MDIILDTNAAIENVRQTTDTETGRPRPEWVPGKCPQCGEDLVSNCYYVGGRGYLIVWGLLGQPDANPDLLLSESALRRMKDQWFDLTGLNREKTPYIRVTALPSRRQYLRYIRSKSSHGSRRSGRGTRAMMFGYGPAVVDAGGPIAQIVLYRDHFTPDSIAHEAFHALIHIFKVYGRSPMEQDRDEEQFARFQGQLTQAIFRCKDEFFPA